MKWFTTLVLLVIGADQLSKKAAMMLLRDQQRSIKLIPDFFSLTYAENRGIAFGLEFAPPLALFFITLLITSLVFWYVLRSENRSLLFLSTFALIVGGAIGNMIDRITMGRVVDFIYFDLYNGTIFGYHLFLWPIFNLADSAITTGACLILLFHNRFLATGTNA